MSPHRTGLRLYGYGMTIPANSNGPTGRLRPTAFKRGQSGNPHGRRPGTRNRRTIEAREVAQRLVDDPDYRDELLQRMIDGTAGAMEPLLWYYAKGKPVEDSEQQSHQFSGVSNSQLRAVILNVIKIL